MVIQILNGRPCQLMGWSEQFKFLSECQGNRILLVDEAVILLSLEAPISSYTGSDI